MKWVKLVWTILKDSVTAFSNQKCIKLSAALAYYTIFSLPPLLIILISIGSFFYEKNAIRDDVFRIISGYVGVSTAEEIQDVLDNISFSGDNTWTTVFGIAMLIFGATGIFGEIQDSINMLWGLKAKPKKSWLTLIVNRLVSFSMILILGFILLTSLTINTMVDLLFSQLGSDFSDGILTLISVLDQILILLVIIVLFTLIFKILPDAKLKWRFALIGASVTATLFMVGQYLIKFYLTDTYIVSAYGATGSLIVMILWVYYSSIILYFGAVFTRSVVNATGNRIEPNKLAVRSKRGRPPEDEHSP